MFQSLPLCLTSTTHFHLSSAVTYLLAYTYLFIYFYNYPFLSTIHNMITSLCLVL